MKAGLGIEWLHAPFTRCLQDNTELARADESHLHKIPPPARSGPGPFTICPTCKRVYWRGSHVRRMLAKLEAWQAT